MWKDLAEPALARNSTARDCLAAACLATLFLVLGHGRVPLVELLQHVGGEKPRSRASSGSPGVVRDLGAGAASARAARRRPRRLRAFATVSPRAAAGNLNPSCKHRTAARRRVVAAPARFPAA